LHGDARPLPDLIGVHPTSAWPRAHDVQAADSGAYPFR
jgi:hypothetical protein